MRLTLIFPGKTRESYIADGVSDFLNRLRHYAKVEMRPIRERRPGKNESPVKIKEEEAKLLFSAVPKGALLVALDPAGKQVTSEELAEQLGRWEDESRREVVFLLGGPLGLPQSIIDRADRAISLSRMTFTHEMARLILLEQIYRAYSIKAGTGYHK